MFFRHVCAQKGACSQTTTTTTKVLIMVKSVYNLFRLLSAFAQAWCPNLCSGTDKRLCSDLVPMPVHRQRHQVWMGPWLPNNILFDNFQSKCGFLLAENQKKRKPFFSHTAGSMGFSVQRVFTFCYMVGLAWLPVVCEKEHFYNNNYYCWQWLGLANVIVFPPL